MAAPRTDARYDRGRIEAVPHARVAAPDCLTHMCHHVHAADQRNLHLALLQTNDHSTVPGPCHSIESPADSRKDLPQISLTMLVTRRYSSRPLNFAANSPGIASNRRSC